MNMQQKRFRKFGSAALAALVLVAGGNAMAIETPQYTVEFTDCDVEYRRYQSYLVAETLIEDVSGFKAAGNEGFRRLFRYITGANDGGESISMTAPVARSAKDGAKIAMTAPVQRAADPGGELVSFMLPSKYTMATAPQPTDPRVQVREVPERLVAVVRYRGRWSDSNYQENRKVLLASVDAAGVTPEGVVESALYDPPYTPPFMRRNEVMVEVSRLPAAVSDEQVVADADSGWNRLLSF